METGIQRAFRKNRDHCLNLDYKTMATELICVQVLLEEDHIWIKSRSLDDKGRMDDLISLVHERVNQRLFEDFLNAVHKCDPGLALLLEHDSYTTPMSAPTPTPAPMISPSVLQVDETRFARHYASDFPNAMFHGPLTFRGAQELSFVIQEPFSFSIPMVSVRYVIPTIYKACAGYIPLGNGVHQKCFKMVDSTYNQNGQKWVYSCMENHCLDTFVELPFIYVAFQDPNGHIFYLTILGHAVLKFLNANPIDLIHASPSFMDGKIEAAKNIQWNLENVLCHKASNYVPFVWMNRVRKISRHFSFSSLLHQYNKA